MKLAYINPQSVPDTLPSTMQILQVADAMGHCGINVDLVTPAPRHGILCKDLLGRALSANVSVHHLRDIRKTWFFPFSSHKPFYLQAKRWIRRHRPEFVYVRNLKLAEEILAMSDRPKVLFETHELFAQTYREDHPIPDSKAQKKINTLVERERKVYAGVEGLITLTQALLDDIRQEYHITTPAIVAPDGVDLQLANQALAKMATNRSSSQNLPILLYIGSLHPWKGVGTLIAAMPHTSPCELWIAGGTDEQISQLRRMAEDNGSIHKIRFLGRVPPLQRFEVIGQADVCVLPLTNTSIASRYTSPLKLFEYMAMGKPIVVADLESIREVLTDNVNAILVKNVDNPLSFATGINHLLADKPLLAQLSKEMLTMSAQYTWATRCQKIIDYFFN